MKYFTDSIPTPTCCTQPTWYAARNVASGRKRQVGVGINRSPRPGAIDLKRAANELNSRRGSPVPLDRHDIEADLFRDAAQPLQVPLARPDEALLFLVRDGRQRPTPCRRGRRADFHETERVTFLGDDIDFTDWEASVALANTVAVIL